jgi:hypothetical protein
MERQIQEGSGEVSTGFHLRFFSFRQFGCARTFQFLAEHGFVHYLEPFRVPGFIAPFQQRINPFQRTLALLASRRPC